MILCGDKTTLLKSKIKNIFNNRKLKMIGEYKKSAVMIFVIEKEKKLYILFEVRNYNLKHQPGDICLPGGKVEEGETPKEAVIRECIEELNIKENDMEFISDMDYFVTPYNFIIYPFISKLNKLELNPNKDEVDHIFKVPLDFFIENIPILHEIEILPNVKNDFPFHLIKGGKEYEFFKGKMKEYFYLYNEYVIWGFTALIVKNFVDIIKGGV